MKRIEEVRLVPSIRPVRKAGERMAVQCICSASAFHHWCLDLLPGYRNTKQLRLPSSGWAYIILYEWASCFDRRITHIDTAAPHPRLTQQMDDRFPSVLFRQFTTPERATPGDDCDGMMQPRTWSIGAASGRIVALLSKRRGASSSDQQNHSTGLQPRD